MVKNETTNIIYNYLRNELNMTHQGASGMLGNMYAESACNPELAEELLIMRYDEDYKGKYSKYGYINGGYKRPVNNIDNINYNDALYIDRLKNGAIDFNEFINPRAYDAKHQYGFGLTQVTSPSRKQQLWNMAKAKGVPIWDLNIQLEHLRWEMFNIFPTVLAFLVDDSKTLAECSDVVLYKFEQPNDADDLREERREYSQFYYTAYKPSGGESMDFTKYYGKISNSGSDERGKLSGGKAGDQSGTEWQIRSWYNRPWTHVLRHPDRAKRELIAELSIEAANNDLIGYDQDERHTFWQQLKASGYRPKNITKACEADCSAGVAAIVKAVGYLKGDTKMQGVSSESYTGNLRAALSGAGFQILTDSKYRTSADYLLPGDILLYEYHHTAINLGIGKNAGSSAPSQSTGDKSILEIEDVSLGSKGPSVWTVTTMLKGRGFISKITDVCDQEVVDAINRYQKAIFESSGQALGNADGSPDGSFGSKCLNDISMGLVRK